MRIGLLSRGRLRTSPIGEYLSKKYNVENQREIYFNNHYVTTRRIFVKNRPLHEKIKDFEDLTLETTEQLFENNGFVVKIWPSMLIYPPTKFSENDSLPLFKEKIIFNISKFVKLNSYDKIFYTNRDIYHTTLSWVYAKRFNRYHYTDSIKLEKMTTTDNDIARAKFYILEACLQEKIYAYCYKLGLNIIDFNEFEQLQEPNITNKYKDLNLDYEYLVTDYKIIKNLCDTFYDHCKNITKDWYYY